MIPANIMRVLIAESSTGVRERLVGMLQELTGVEIVGQATDVATARLLARRLRPDLTILDTLDSSGDWIGLLQFLKASRPDAKTIVMTNFVDPEHREMCLRNGADFFFDKSIEFDKAVAAVRGLQKPPAN
jgi:DNA-binding NarL/FixJ family response regulator